MGAVQTAVRWGGAALAAATVGAVGWRARALTAGGALAATAVGTTTLARGGLPAAAALVTFFITSSGLTRLKEREKARRGVLAQAKGGRRDAWQVLANGGIAAASLAVGGRWETGAFLGALATAGADTWATELGLLARRSPRLVTTLRPVPPGTSGGVTPEGTLASVAGAFTTGAAWAAARRTERRIPWRSGFRAAGGQGPHPGRVVLAASIAGTLGALVDSLLGATVQGAYWCPACAEPTEAPRHRRCVRATQLVRGWAWVDNDVVNALATGFGAASGAVLAGHS